MILCHGNLPAFTETMGKNWKQLVAALGLELREVERRAGGKDRTVARHFLNIYIYVAGTFGVYFVRWPRKASSSI